MDPARYRRIDELLEAALAEPPETRSAFLDRCCSGDPELRGQVEALLRAHEEAGEFIESPAFALAPEALADEEEESADALLAPGQMLGHHRILELLGSGGMGDVYLAEDVRLGRRVALKVLSRRLAGDERSRKRFLREARLASTLEHGNICTIWETGEADGWPFISMRLVEGRTLRESLRESGGKPLPARSVVAIALQVAQALAAAHAKRIVHRDITSGNVLIDAGGHATVVDFGLALPGDRRVGAGGELTRTGAIHGTPVYMSPEQARGHELDPRSDLFSLGIVMYEMATGRRPFERESHAETMNAIIHDAHAPAAELNPEISLELSRIIDRALAKEPAARYAAVGELIEDLERVARMLDALPPHSSRPHARGAWNRTWFSARGLNRRARGLGLAAAVVVATLGGVFIVERRSDPEAAITAPGRVESIAVLPFKPLVEIGRDEVLEMGMTDALITRLSSVRELAVRPMSAVRRYAGVEQDAVQAGREQRVDAVLEGSIQRREEDIRVTVRLVRVEDGRIVWASSFDEKLKDIFAVQDSIAERVTRALSLRLDGQPKGLSNRRDPETYRAYLLGTFHSQQGTLDSLRKSVEHFTSAVASDPEYALAWAGLAHSYASLERFGVFAEKRGYAKAREAALRALSLDETLAEPHLVLALVAEGVDWDWEGAERSYRNAIALSPNHSGARRSFARFLAAMGRGDEAVAEAERALALDPVSVSAISNLGFTLYMARRYDEAIEQIRTALEMNPRYGEAHFLLGLAQAARGNHEAAVAAFEKAIELTGRREFQGTLGAAYARAGRTAEARQILADLLADSERERVPSIGIAALYLALGDEERAFEWLENMVDGREWNVHILKAAPDLDPIRADPRFDSLLRRVGFTPTAG